MAQGPSLSVPEWDAQFLEGGDWERNGGRQQTRRFAECFCKRTTIPARFVRTLADIGCALGDAMPALGERFPGARLFGFDISPTAIERAQSHYGHLATFTHADVRSIPGRFELIYCSNVLEHLHDWKRVCLDLLQRAEAFAAFLVPFEERIRLRGAKDGRDHVVSFNKRSFGFLQTRGFRIRQISVFSCPGAWGWDRTKRLKKAPRNLRRRLKGKQPHYGPRQLLVEVKVPPDVGYR